MTHITQAQPRSRPILFNSAMSRAVRSGMKTQTRRIVKGLNDKMWIEESANGGFLVCYDSEPSCGTGVWDVKEHSYPLACPYGAVGDRLWGRETYSGPHWMTGTPPRDWLPGTPIWYWADNNPGHGDWTKPKPGMHMPRWASRILLEITEVRVERLNEISEADCWAEGIEQVMYDFTDESQVDMAYRLGLCIEDAKPLYAQLWESINGPRSWDVNPFVWRVSFRVVKP